MLLRLPSFDAYALSTVLYAAAALPQPPDAWLNELAAEVVAKAQLLDGRALANCLWGLACLRYNPPQAAHFPASSGRFPAVSTQNGYFATAGGSGEIGAAYGHGGNGVASGQLAAQPPAPYGDHGHAAYSDYGQFAAPYGYGYDSQLDAAGGHQWHQAHALNGLDGLNDTQGFNEAASPAASSWPADNDDGARHRSDGAPGSARHGSGSISLGNGGVGVSAWALPLLSAALPALRGQSGHSYVSVLHSLARLRVAPPPEWLAEVYQVRLIDVLRYSLFTICAASGVVVLATPATWRRRQTG